VAQSSKIRARETGTTHVGRPQIRYPYSGMKLCTASQMQEVDRRAAAEFGMPSLLLMENAGAAVARRVWERLQHPGGCWGPVLFACGPGNNGGDGFVAARRLANRGVPVSCFLVGSRERVAGDALVNLELLERLGISLPAWEPGVLPAQPQLVVDALLGTGFRGALREPTAAAAAWMRKCGAPVVAIDVPSGVDADTGAAADLAIQAVETITFGLPKLGLVQEPGRSHVGRLVVADISLPRPLLENPAFAEWITAREAAPWWPERPAAAHKGSAGRVLLLAGSPGLTGAAALAGEAALRAGAGLVTVGVPASLNPILEVKLTEAMTLPLPETPGGGLSLAGLAAVQEQLPRLHALAVGPGLGRDPETGKLLRALLDLWAGPVVVDADGLNLLAPARPGAFPSGAVLTPHPGELARLLGTAAAEVESNRIETVRAAAREFGCVVVLKGPGTCIAGPDGRLSVNGSGGPALATGGAGDVLTGIVAAALARGLPPYEAARAGVFLHGLLGDLAGESMGAPGAVAGDLVRLTPAALQCLRAGKVASPYDSI